MDLLGACVVSKTQYASLVSATRTPFHLISRCLGVFSSRGGRGKLKGLSGALGGISPCTILCGDSIDMLRASRVKALIIRNDREKETVCNDEKRIGRKLIVFVC